MLPVLTGSNPELFLKYGFINNKKERLQYLAAGTAGTANTQKAGYGAITDRAAGESMPVTTVLFLFFISPTN